MKQYTDITVLLDRSGSMMDIKTDMEGGFKEFLKAHKKVPSTRLSLYQFDTGPVEQVYVNQSVKNINAISIHPRGSTALLDAMCDVIDRTGERLAALPASERPDQVLFIVITDGQENASSKYKRSDVADRVKHQSSKYGWNFMYLGANQDAFAEAASFGIKQDWTLNYVTSDAGITNTFAAMAANTVSYTTNTGRLRGSSAALKFSDEQRLEAEDK